MKTPVSPPLTIQVFVKPLTHISFPTGWGNGYVCLPPGHPCYGMDYDDIHDKYPIDVHGGLTFAASAAEAPSTWPVPDGCEDSWIVGFDTAHGGDDLTDWPEIAVLEHTVELAKQFENIK